MFLLREKTGRKEKEGMMGLPAPGLRRRKQCDLWFSFRPVISLRTSKNFYCATDFEKTKKTASPWCLQRETRAKRLALQNLSQVTGWMRTPGDTEASVSIVQP